MNDLQCLREKRTDVESGKDWHEHVWLKNDYTYQLEFQDGSAAERYQTRTISQARVIDALSWVG